MKSVAIIGAGITGLTAAFYLKRKKISVTIYEANSRVGGAIQSLRQNNFLAEFGPNTIAETSPKISELISDLNLESRRHYTNPNAKKRFIVRAGKPMAMPDSPLKFLTTKIFSARAKFALLREPFIPPRRADAEESVADFVLRRLNREFLERAIDPLVAGIYAGDAEKLSVAHAFPNLFALEKNYGSLLRGQILSARARKKTGEISRRDAKLFSFDEGLQILPDALQNNLGDAIHLNSRVEKISQTLTGWILTVRENGIENFFEHDAAIFCGTAYKLAELKIDFIADEKNDATAQTFETVGRDSVELKLKIFSEIRHPPIASVVLGFPRANVAHALDGFGMLIPKIENFKILGTIFSSSLFPNRAPGNFVTLTSYVGGERQPELAFLPPDKLIELVRADLQKILGARGEPVFSHVALYPQAIPQYNVGYGRYKNLLTEIENKARGLFFAGSFRDGISLGDSILSGCNVVERVANFFQ